MSQLQQSYLEQQNLDIEILMELGIMIGIIKWVNPPNKSNVSLR